MVMSFELDPGGRSQFCLCSHEIARPMIGVIMTSLVNRGSLFFSRNLVGVMKRDVLVKGGLCFSLGIQ